MSLNTADLLLITSFAIIFLVGTLGNGLVYYIFKFKLSKTLTTMDLLICYLAVVDFISSILNPFVYTYWQATHYEVWHFGQIPCKILAGTSAITVNMSMGLIILITLDRCRLICQPFKPNFSKMQARIAVAVVFVLSVAVKIPYISATDLMSHTKMKYLCYDLPYRPPSNANVNVLATRHVDESNNTELYTNTSQILTRHFNTTKVKTYHSKDIAHSLEFLAYMSCNEVENKNITARQASNDASFQPFSKESNYSQFFQSHDFLLCNRSCTHLSISCNPPRQSGKDAYIEIAVFVIQMFVFFTVLIVSITLIRRTLYNKKRESVLSGKSMIDRRKVVALLVVMATVFVTLAFPKNLFHMAFTLSWMDGSNGISYSFAKNFNSFLTVLQISNSACNPMIYGGLHRRFRQELKRLRRGREFYSSVSRAETLRPRLNTVESIHYSPALKKFENLRETDL